MGPPLQSQSESESFGFGRGPPPQGQQHQLRVGPPLQGDFVRRVVPRPAPTRGRGTSGLHTNAIRSDEIPLQRRPSQPWCSPFRRATSLAQSRSHSRQSVLDGIDEATDMQVAKDAVVRGSGASRPWMACARLLEPGMAESGDAPDPRTAAAPPEAENSSALRPHCRGSTRSQWTPAHFDLAGSGIPQLGEEPKKERGPRPALPDRTTRGERPAVQNLRFCAQ